MPENTIEGFEYILDNDIIAIEFDVLLTKDEIPVITHDLYLSKAITRNSEGNWLSKDGPRISNLTSSQLEVFDVCLLYTSPSPRDMRRYRMPSSA